ncbi:T9SS type A sorting domain-containing protein [Pontibacter cellulosilyticus]|uniref:T9SS type A sorting domain-containing protein n=1 Tax=Pontibacter cellulosilyticus TaxID=1720253 RepID=A0A923SI69_9BACT|nr:T9SS type A sorting domain-containing protein [Pontibacter cellulosilyticus]MBC5992438.1 T9SS type A sorting domain-containing protein [Pontibacter cellulosilyticus]
MKKALAIILFILVGSAVASAQAVLAPLQQEQHLQQSIKSTLRQAAAPQSLPFFDDFATVSVVPDPNRWINGGVYVNNRYAQEPITINVASFDGLNANGIAYAPGTTGTGASDTLTTQPILLAGLTPADSVYLSFYWQSGGFGDIPDRSEQVYLLLEFRDAAGNWQEVWRQTGLGEVTPFAQVFIGLKDPKYFHNNFQFRFRSVGQRNGIADVWNVDYVLLDRNRRKGQSITRDIAISQGISKLLKHYTAMPAVQFLQNKQQELAVEVKTTVNNLGGLPGAISWRGYIKKQNDAAADTFLRGQGLIPGNARQFAITGVPRIDNLELDKNGFILVHGVRLITNEADPLQRANDSTQRKTVFANYYAYDDGTAEASFSFPGSSSTQVAQRFDLNQPDQVSAFRIYFPRVRTNLAGTSLTFKVWADNNGVPGEILHQQNFQIQYSDKLNEFYEVQLSKPVPVSGSFYIGWQQPGNLFVNVGFDRNEVATGRRFLFTTLNQWTQDTQLQGAIMMRPVLVGEALGLAEEMEAARIKVFPNPADGRIYIEGEYDNLRIYTVTGQQVYQHKYKTESEPIDLKSLAPGFYTLRIQTRKAIITKKIILN